MSIIALVIAVPLAMQHWMRRRGSPWIALAALALAGLLLLFTIPVNLVMGQRLVPTQAGTVSSLMMGFAWGTAGLLFIPIVGSMADRFGLGNAMAAVSAFPLLGFFLALRIDENA